MQFYHKTKRKTKLRNNNLQINMTRSPQRITLFNVIPNVKIRPRASCIKFISKVLIRNIDQLTNGYLDKRNKFVLEEQHFY